jgi:hypothetical protein
MGCLERVRALLFVAFPVELSDGLGDAKRFGVERSLGNETIGEREAEDASNASGETEQEEIPMKAGGFGEGKFAALGDEGRD